MCCKISFKTHRDSISFTVLNWMFLLSTTEVSDWTVFTFNHFYFPPLRCLCEHLTFNHFCFPLLRCLCKHLTFNYFCFPPLRCLCKHLTFNHFCFPPLRCLCEHIWFSTIFAFHYWDVSANIFDKSVTNCFLPFSLIVNNSFTHSTRFCVNLCVNTKSTSQTELWTEWNTLQYSSCLEIVTRLIVNHKRYFATVKLENMRAVFLCW